MPDPLPVASVSRYEVIPPSPEMLRWAAVAFRAWAELYEAGRRAEVKP